MPIEIRELVIRTVIDARGGDEDDDAGASFSGGGGGAQDDMVAECVRQVLQILRREKER